MITGTVVDLEYAILIGGWGLIRANDIISRAPDLISRTNDIISI